MQSEMERHEIQCPIPPAIHPDAAEADAESVAWMRQFGLCADETERARLARTGCGLLAARIVPHASRETLQIVANFFIWNVSFDDEYCDEGPLSTRPGDLARVLSLLLRTIEIPERKLFFADKYATAMRDIRLQLDRHASSAQMEQWIGAMRSWFLAETWKAGNVATNRMPTLAEYMLLRMYSGGPLAFPVLAGIAEGYEIPPCVLANRRIRAMTELASSLCTWVSDIVSYDKEARREIGGHNLVMVIQHERQCTKDEAVTMAVAIYDRALRLFLRMRNHVEANLPASAPLRRYLRSLAHLIRAPVDWCHLSERYVESIPGCIDIIVAVAPARTVPQDGNGAPLPISSISWWWEYDPE
ncbi:hypothetical protein WS67_00015 [Burkholderia singularis]|uniref:Terpene synthase n=1 Tax=Burkholderia singularis TaxID=1503053 RepID=A0A103E771_9BURK|nr:hypothetical protein [Burkholderia singularis]KVE29657.1 hypothetical protein WS67_00015 [Burkholderia singularis]